MANVRVYELAKELGMSNSELIDALAAMGVQVKSHSSSIDEETAGKVRESLEGKASPAAKEKREITLPDGLTVKQLAEFLEVSTGDIQKALVKQRALVAVNQVVPQELAKSVAESLGFSVLSQDIPEVKVEEEPVKVEKKAPKEAPKPKSGKPAKKVKLETRPPIVTILGHVDHGKTTLLDMIRKTSVTESEFGGITQHIGAYQVEVHGNKITFLDTPGHAAFTAMRARGAQVTDIVVLVVAADDGVMPQTVEAIDHAKAAGVPIIAAINKVDKKDANVDRTKQQLAEHNLLVEDWGGDTVSVELSAKEGKNIDELLEMILLVSEMAELKADPHGDAAATVVEAQLDKGKGPIATVLVQSGTLKQGDVVVVGKSYGRVKAMIDDKGNRLKEAPPSMPVEILGLSSVPLAGDKLEIAANEKEARQTALSRESDERAERLSVSNRVTLADLYKQLQEGVVKELNLILKADVQGSAEAVQHSLETLCTDEVKVNLISTGVGAVGENDVLLASASNAVVIGFNVKVDPQAKRTAETERIDVRTYNIIYELIDEVCAAMEGLLEPILQESVIGHIEVRQTFRIPRGGVVAGSYVTDGKAQRGAEVRVMRGEELIHTGKISSLKHIKDDVKEIASGYECGVMIDGFNEYEPGDILEMFVIEEIARKIKK